MRRQLVRHAERHHVDQAAQVGIEAKPLGVDPAERGEEAEVEVALLLRGAQEEVAARELEHPAAVVVAERIEPERLGVVQVLEQPGIVEVDRERQVGGKLERRVVGELTLRHHGVAVGEAAPRSPPRANALASTLGPASGVASSAPGCTRATRPPSRPSRRAISR